MTPDLKILLTLCATASLSACGGGSSSLAGSDAMMPQGAGVPTSADGVNGLSSADVLAVSASRADAFPDLEVTPDVSAVAPGAATYFGTVTLVVGDDLTNNPDNSDAYLGVVDLDVEFTNETVTGEAGSFFNVRTQAAADGTLVLEDGDVLIGPLESLTGNLRGDLDIDGQETEFDVNANGIFRGVSAEANSGLLSGVASDGSTIQDVTGAWQILAE